MSEIGIFLRPGDDAIEFERAASDVVASEATMVLSDIVVVIQRIGKTKIHFLRGETYTSSAIKILF